MYGKHEKEGECSTDENDSESDGTDMVQYSSCQHPVVLHLVLRQFQRCRRRLRCFRRQRREVVPAAAVTGVHARDVSVRDDARFRRRRRRPSRTQTRCQSLVEQIPRLLRRTA